MPSLYWPYFFGSRSCISLVGIQRGHSCLSPTATVPSLSIADVDKDGHPDIALVTRYAPGAIVLYGRFGP